MINDVLRDLLNICVFVYLDDILMFFKVQTGACGACTPNPPEALGVPALR